MAYGANLSEMWRRAADYVAKLFKGAKLADLPVEQPMTFELVLQPQDRPGPRPHHPADAPLSGRRGYPLSCGTGAPTTRFVLESI